jgi:predicted double-glycine peptidase
MNLKEALEAIKGKDENVIKFPDSRQATNYTCRASALQSVLLYYGIEEREDIIVKKLGIKENGLIDYKKYNDYIRHFGLKHEERSMTIDDLKSYIEKRVPVIVGIQAWRRYDKDIDWAKDWSDGHFVVVIGFEKDKIIFDDPSIHSRRGYMSIKEFKERWHDKDVHGKKYINWGIAITGKKPKFDPDELVKIESLA